MDFSITFAFVQQTNKTYLFSIDLEDIRFLLKDGNSYPERVSINTKRYLDWLDKKGAKCTFFVVGNIAKAYPLLVKEIYDRGHEIACHTNMHIPLDKQTPEEFKRDIEQNLASLKACGVENITGFRAPIFSLTQETDWAYDILKELGFTYSSSILPAKSPLYGWKAFGKEPKTLTNGLMEIPMSVGNFGPLTVPYAGGVYFRILPSFLIRKKFRKEIAKKPVLGYFHPYDIDFDQERFMMPGINNSKLYNYLMYFNRKNVFKRLNKLVKNDIEIIRYDTYVKKIAN